MKRSFLFLALAFSQIQAQQVIQIHQPVKIIAFQNPAMPLVILDHFARNYPAVTPIWGMEKGNYTVRYTDPENGLGRIISYDHHGTVTRVQSELYKYSYPESITLYFNKKYPNESFKVWVSEDSKGNVGYYSKYRSKTIWFDKDGNYKPRRFRL